MKHTIKGVAQDFLERNYKEGFLKIAENAVPSLDNITKLLIGQDTNIGTIGKIIKEEMNHIIENPTEKTIKSSLNKIINYTQDGIKDIKNKEFKAGFGQFKRAGVEVLDCMQKLFEGIKQGFEKGFENVKNGINIAFNKLQSLTQSKEQNRS